MRDRVRFRRDLVTFAIGLVLAVGTLLGSLQLSGDLFQGETHRVRALMPTTSSLGEGSRVTMAGAPVGQVREIRRQGHGTLVELDITDESVVPVPVDSRAVLRQRTPVGENYIELVPGRSARTLPEDGTLAISRSGEYVDVDEVLSVLQGPSREAARELIQGMGGGLDGRGEDLNATLGDAAQVVRSGASVLTVLSEDRRRLASLADRLGRVSAAVGERGAAVRVLADRGLAALRAVGSRDTALRSTLSELPATLRQVRGSSAALREASQVAAPVLREAAAAVGDLRPAVGHLRPAAQQGRNAVRELGRAAGPLEDLLAQARRTSGPLAGALPELRRTICQVAPMARYLEPYTSDVIGAVIGLGSASNSYDAVGHLIRLTPIVGENSLVGLPEEVSRAAYTLLRTGLLGKSSGLTWHPYPEPGKIGTESAADGRRVFGPEDVPKTGWKYPRVHADC